MAGEWIKWQGGKCPARSYDLVCVRLRSGEENSDYAEHYHWDHGNPDHGDRDDIIAYRLAQKDTK